MRRSETVMACSVESFHDRCLALAERIHLDGDDGRIEPRDPQVR